MKSFFYILKKYSILFLLLPTFVYASPSWLWLNANQRGLYFFQQGDFLKAATLFTTPKWRGIAYYRAGRFNQALSYFNDPHDPTSLYNRGNTLAHLGRYQEAIDAYEKALHLQPQFTDARYNETILKQLRQQQLSSANATTNQQNTLQNSASTKTAASNVLRKQLASTQQQTNEKLLGNIEDNPGSLLQQIFLHDYVLRHQPHDLS